MKGLTLNNVRLQFATPDLRPAVILDLVTDASISGLNVQADASTESVPRFIDSKDILITAPRLLSSTAAFLQLEGKENQNITVDGGDAPKLARHLP